MVLFDAESWLDEHIAELNKADDAAQEATDKLGGIKRVLSLFDMVNGTLRQGLLDEEFKFLQSELKKAQDHLEVCSQRAEIAERKLRVIQPIRDTLSKKQRPSE